MPKSKWILLLLSCLLLAGGVFYWQEKERDAPAPLQRSSLTQARTAEESSSGDPEVHETNSGIIEQALQPADTAVRDQTEAEWVFATEPLMVNINTASGSELEKLPGIGPGKAQAILDYRRENGPFQTIEELMQVPGIKEGTFARLKDYVTV